MKISDYIKGPVKYDPMGQMILDDDKNLICDIRGWGRIQYMDEPEKIQDFIGKTIAVAINEKLEEVKKGD